MGKRGPAPKPTSLRLLQGNPGKRPLNKQEPKPEILKSKDPPNYFSDEAVEVWNRLVPMLARIGLFTEADYNTLVRYIDMLMLYDKAREEVEISGATYTAINKQGGEYIAQRPEVSIMRTCSEHLLKIEQQFGLTPASRTSIKVDLGSGADVSTGAEDPFA